MAGRPHPFDQLTIAECKKAAQILLNEYKGKKIHIKNVQTHEPPKKEMIVFLEAEKRGENPTPPARVAYAYYYIMEDRRAEEMWINLDEGYSIERRSFAKGIHPPCDQVELDREEITVMKDPTVLKALADLGITGDLLKAVSPDGWMYGSDSEELTPRYLHYLMYMRDPKTNHPESNPYAFPLPIVPVVDVFESKVVRIDKTATGGDGDEVMDFNTRNTDEPILNTLEPREYLAELRPDIGVREGLKPYNVIQPEGPSFEIDGSLVKWQKWEFRVGFNPREGLVLYDLRFDGRMTFYRLSVSEMTVPYGDPRPPLHRKQAFDLGDIGAGYSANSLGLGCDCLGTIKYFDGNLVHADATTEARKNVVCMHEQDDGILYKHNNYRTNVSRVARRRILILQTILTVANYEYIFAWQLDQAANISLEIRATGILSTQYIDKGKTSYWGTVVSPSVLAPSHQHIFSMRIDPAIDGHKNTVAVCDTKLDPLDENNPYGVGFYNDTKYVEKSCALDADTSVNRFIKIVNENKINPITKTPIGYKIMGLPTALIMARPGSVARSRAEFATHHFWISDYKDQEVYGGGVWTNQASKEAGGCADAIKRNANVRNEDVVLWHSFGLTHHPRIEDWPVMPLERMMVSFHPYNFFTENPALDIPQSNQHFNRSVEVMENNCCQRL